MGLEDYKKTLEKEITETEQKIETLKKIQLPTPEQEKDIRTAIQTLSLKWGETHNKQLNRPRSLDPKKIQGLQTHLNTLLQEQTKIQQEKTKINHYSRNEYENIEAHLTIVIEILQLFLSKKEMTPQEAKKIEREYQHFNTTHIRSLAYKKSPSKTYNYTAYLGHSIRKIEQALYYLEANTASLSSDFGKPAPTPEEQQTYEYIHKEQDNLKKQLPTYEKKCEYEEAQKQIPKLQKKLQKYQAELQTAQNLLQDRATYPTAHIYDDVLPDEALYLHSRLQQVHNSLKDNYTIRYSLNHHDPLFNIDNIATEQEINHIYTSLHVISQNTPPIQALISPERFVIIPQDIPQAYTLGTIAFISRAFLYDTRSLPTVLVWLIATQNLPPHTPDSTDTLIARNMAQNFEQEQIYTRREVQKVAITQTYTLNQERQEFVLVGDETDTNNSPESLRPRPLDIITGSFHNFTDFYYTYIRYEGNLGKNTTTRKGTQAIDLYLENLPKSKGNYLDTNPCENTHLYFRYIDAWKTRFKSFQKATDELTAQLGYGSQLQDIIQRNQSFAPSANQDTILMSYTPAQRIEYLRKI